MQPADFLNEIQRVLPGPVASQVIIALRQDALVWRSLERDSFFNAALMVAGGNPGLWSPASLALLALECGLSVKELTSLHPVELEKTLRQKALLQYEETLRLSKKPSTLAEAGLLALALRERRRKMLSWQGLRDELLEKNERAAKINYSIWRTPLACLYGMINDPGDMLCALLSAEDNDLIYPLLTHIVLSNPLSLHDQVRIFSELIAKQPPAPRLEILRNLHFRGRSELVAQLAQILLIGPAQPASEEGQDLEKPLRKAVELERLATLYRLSNQTELARKTLTEALEATRFFLSGLGIQAADVAGYEAISDEGIFSKSTIQWERLTTEHPDLASELALSFSTHPQGKNIIRQYPASAGNPLVQILQAGLLAEEGNFPAAKEAALAGFNKIISQQDQYEEIDFPRIVFNWQPVTIVKTLEQLGLEREALRLCELILKVRPSDLQILEVSGRLWESQKDSGQALSLAQMQVLLDPENPAWRRRLAGLLEEIGDWSKSFEERNLVLKLVRQAGIDDTLAYARSAQRIGEARLAMTAASKVLEEQPDNGLANAIAGQTLVDLGDFEGAQSFLNRATMLAPADASNWLKLAEVYERTGEKQRQLETLQAAAAVTENAEINFALAEVLLQFEKPSDALLHYRKAVSLAPESWIMALQLGKVLQINGDLTEANRVLQEARQNSPQNAQLAYAHAEILLAERQIQEGLRALKEAIRLEPASADWLVRYAEVILNELPDSRCTGGDSFFRVELTEAYEALEKADALKPDDNQIRLLLAEVLQKRGDTERAFDIYKKLIDHLDHSFPESVWRVQFGLSQTALKLGQIETALAALREASQLHPGNLSVQQLLAEAYLASDLKDDAIRCAREAYLLAPEELANMMWFANFAIPLGCEAEAADILQKAVELSAGSPDILLRLAELRLKNGEVQAGVELLHQLLSLLELSAWHLRWASSLFLQTGDQESALSCLERAAQSSPDSAAVCWLEAACIKTGSGDLETAQDLLHKAAEGAPDEAYIYVFQADVFSAMRRPQAALACLDYAIHLEEDGQGGDVSLGLGESPVINLLQKRWLASAQDPALVYGRYARLMYQTGDPVSALNFLTKKLEDFPESLTLRYAAAEFSRSLLQISGAKELAELPAHATLLEFTNRIEDSNATQEDVYFNLFGLQLELALEADEEVQASRILNEVLSQASQQARILAAQARLLARHGDMKAALEVFLQARTILDQQQTTDNSVGRGSLDQFISLGQGLDQWKLWMAEAAIDVQMWDEAVRLSEEYVKNNLLEPYGFLVYVRILVRCAERQRLCAELSCVTHSPGDDKLSEEYYHKFTSAIERAGQRGSSPEVSRWRVVGEVVFRPTAKSINALVNSSFNPKDTAALVMALRVLNNGPTAIHAAQRAPDQKAVLLQLVLCYQGADAEKGFSLARKAVESNPADPLCHAALALVAQKIDQTALALQSLETALHYWPDEPEWHAWAARLADQTGSAEEVIAHWQKSFELEPGSVEYGLALGRAYLAHNLAAKAVDALEKVCRLEFERSEVWLELAKAYLQMNNLHEALKVGSQAARLDASSPQPLLLCGEISLRAGQISKAMEFGQSALKRDPSDANSIVFLARVLERQGKGDESLRFIEKSLPIVRSKTLVLLEQAVLVHKLQGAKTALPYIKNLVEQEPENAQVLSLLAQAEAECGDLKSAERSAYIALRLNPETPRINFLMAQLQKKAGQLDQAIHYFSEAIRQQPTDVEAYLELGQTYQDRREFQQAVQVYQQAMRVSPQDYRPYYQAALVFREGKDYLAAETMLRRAAELCPDDLNIRRQLGAVVALNLVHNVQEVSKRI